MAEEKRNDEIDLIELFQKLGKGIKNMFNYIFNLFYSILLFFIRKSILIFIVVVIGLTFGFYKYKTSPRFYSSSLEAYSNAMASLDMIHYVNNLNEMFKEEDITGLESNLGLDSLELEKIKNVKAYKVIDLNKDGVTDFVDFDEKYETSDTSISRSRFVIRVEVYDQKSFPLIQEGILNYIGDNNYIKELNTVRKKQLNDLITKLDIEISSLDSLKNTEYFQKEDQLKSQAGQLLVLNEKSTQLYHPQIISLYKQKQDLERTLELKTDPITIIQDFSALSIVTNNLLSYLKFYGIVSIILGILLSILLENFKAIKSIIADSRK